MPSGAWNTDWAIGKPGLYPQGSPVSIVSFFDQFPEYNGIQLHFRGSDGYCKVSELNKALGGKRFADWMRTKFAKEVVAEISRLSGIPINRESQTGGGGSATPLIDYDRSSGDGVWIHPYLVSAYALQDPKLYARVSIWMGSMKEYGTANVHHKDWSVAEYLRGVQYNRDDIDDLYGRRRD